MPAESKAQQHTMGAAKAVKTGKEKLSDIKPASFRKMVGKIAKSMPEKEVDKFAKTKTKNLPQHVSENEAPKPSKHEKLLKELDMHPAFKNTLIKAILHLSDAYTKEDLITKGVEWLLHLSNKLHKAIKNNKGKEGQPEKKKEVKEDIMATSNSLKDPNVAKMASTPGVNVKLTNEGLDISKKSLNRLIESHRVIGEVSKKELLEFIASKRS
jgi:hypothetical protein